MEEERVNVNGWKFTEAQTTKNLYFKANNTERKEDLFITFVVALSSILSRF